MTNEKKETVQYITAISGFVSGIIMCFLSFFLHEYKIESSVLMYTGEMIMFAAGVFGLNMVIKTKVLEAESNIRKEVDRRLDNIDRLFKTEKEGN